MADGKKINAETERDRLDDLFDRLDEFVEQYELDMRGDKDTSDGKRGIVNEIREIKKNIDDFPSLTWLLSHKPIRTIGSIMSIFLLLQLVYEYTPPLLTGLLKVLGFSMP